MLALVQSLHILSSEGIVTSPAYVQSKSEQEEVICVFVSRVLSFSLSLVGIKQLPLNNLSITQVGEQQTDKGRKEGTDLNLNLGMGLGWHFEGLGSLPPQIFHAEGSQKSCLSYFYELILQLVGRPCYTSYQ